MEKRGMRLKRLREEMGLSVSDLSYFLEIDSKDVINLENDEGKLNLSILNNLCDLYCCDEKYILCLSNKNAFRGFKVNNIPKEDLNAIAKLNQIYKNTQYLLKKMGD